MNDNSSQTQDLKETLPLKLPEPEIQEDSPWADDALKRSDVAEKLTKLISGQSDPFVISLHGHWGTGKTFLLNRWQKQLEKDGFRAIYFNAWEDDFCDDPFVAIIGQLSHFLKRKGIKGLADKIRKAAKPLLIQGALLEFVAMALLCAYVRDDQLIVESTRSAPPHLNAEEPGTSLVLLPRLEEQSAIAEYLDKVIADIDIATNRAHREIKLLKEYSTRLIADVVTGKLDVGEAAFKLPEVPDDLSLSDTVDDVTHKKIVDDHAH